jgi:parafibromin
VIRNRARKSTNASYTSSIRKLRRGATPLNTPDLRETYRVKRSPSAETEEFFKIDISIRGGTSYLPSEARRVHTPPLPRDGPGQKRMGFFFDYTAPSPTGVAAVDARAAESGKCPPSPSAQGRPVRSRTVGGRHWLETQLAGLAAVNVRGNESKRTAGLMRDPNRENEVVDWNVPEHLPSSPLCPRHEKHRGGGREVCWMHGRDVCWMRGRDADGGWRG